MSRKSECSGVHSFGGMFGIPAPLWVFPLLRGTFWPGCCVLLGEGESAPKSLRPRAPVDTRSAGSPRSVAA